MNDKKLVDWLKKKVECLLSFALAATQWSNKHVNSTGTRYTVGTLVWYQGNVYKCKSPNDGIVPTNTFYWELIGKGWLLSQEQSDFEATQGPSYIRNKPTKLSDFENDITIGENSRHNDLQGLNDGDYIHLTQLEKEKFNNLPNNFAPVATSNKHSELNLDDGTNPHETTKADVGLGNVDNTSDVDKPISTATQNALNLKANAKWEGIDDVSSGSGVTGVTIETLDKTYHILPNVLRNGHLDFSLYSIRETGASLLYTVIVRVNNVNNFATATEIFRSTTGGNFSPHLRAQRKFTLKNNLIRNAFIVSNSDLVASATGVSVPFNLSGDLYIFLSIIPGATNQVIKFDSVQIKQL